MSLEEERDCPECDETRTFWKTASSRIHLGTKRKWECSECGYRFVCIDGTIDTGVA